MDSCETLILMIESCDSESNLLAEEINTQLIFYNDINTLRCLNNYFNYAIYSINP